MIAGRGRALKNVLVTGGAGFIGSNFIRYLLSRDDFSGRIINLDKLTYAGNSINLADIEDGQGGRRYSFEKIDICSEEQVFHVFREYEIDTVVHFAAESHVDRSILDPRGFLDTNVIGTFNLLAAARGFWGDREDVLFHHVSTDEVYGSLSGRRSFVETTPYAPRNPYSASKAASDHMVRAYFHTFSLPRHVVKLLQQLRSVSVP